MAKTAARAMVMMHSSAPNLVPSAPALQTQRGFTLLEVLVASLILFVSLAAGLSAYQAAMGGSQRAAQHVQMLQVAELAQAHIKKALQDETLTAESRGTPLQQLSGRTRLLAVDIEWQATLIQQGAAPPRFDEETLTDAEYMPRFFRYEVELWLRSTSSAFAGELQQSNRRGRAQLFRYTELAWFARSEVASE